MKKHLSIACLGCLLLVLACRLPELPFLDPSATEKPPFSTPSPSDPPPLPEISTAGIPFTLSWDEFSLFLPGLDPAYHASLTNLDQASVYHLALSLSDPPTRVRALEQIRFTNQESRALDSLALAIYPEILGGTIDVTAVRLDGELVTPQHEHGLLRLPVLPALAPGAELIIEIAFELHLPSQGGDAYYGIFGFNAGTLSLAHAFPTVLVFDSQGWHASLPDLDGDPLFSDTSFYVVSVDAPARLTLVASGTEIQRTQQGDRQQVVFANGPARDFYLAASEDLVLHSRSVDGVTVNSYTALEHEAASAAVLEAGSAALDLFARLYGTYPYTEFDILPIETSAGGVEYPGMTAVAGSLYNPYSQDFLELVIVHEIAHQWFYNLVGNDNQSEPWLDEALAEFLTWEYYRLHSGEQAAGEFEQDARSWWLSASDSELPIGLPVSAYSTGDYGAIVYGKGPFFFDALRARLGQTDFDTLMQAYVQTYAWGIASASGFQELAEARCACELDDLFAVWIEP